MTVLLNRGIVMTKPSPIHTLGHNAEAAYDTYLMKQGPNFVKAVSDFEERVNQSYLKYGRFTIPTFLKPHFLTANQEKLIKKNTEIANALLEKVIRLYFEEPIVKHAFQLSKEAELLMEIDPGYERQVPISRFDCFLEGETLKFIEMNTDSPAGVGYADLLENLFFQTDEFSEFFEAFHFRRESRTQKLYEALISAYSQFRGGSNSNPRIAIMDWRTVKTKHEFEALKSFFESQGCPTCIADPRDLKLKQGKLYHDDFQIDLVYRRSILKEILERLDEVQDFIKAYEKKAVCVVNSLRAPLVANNRVLSLLTNPRHQNWFTEEENKFIQEMIPWTRRMSDAEQYYGSKKIYMIDFLKDEKETLILKPSKDSDAKNVIIGSDATEEIWNKTIDVAMKDNWVIQEAIRIPQFNVPIVSDGKMQFLLKKVSIHPFVFEGRYSACLSRLSDDSVINIAHGGGLIPAVAEEEEHNR